MNKLVRLSTPTVDNKELNKIKKYLVILGLDMDQMFQNLKKNGVITLK